MLSMLHLIMMASKRWGGTLSPATTPGIPGGFHPNLFNFIDLDLFRLDRSDYNEVVLPKPFLVITIMKGS